MILVINAGSSSLKLSVIGLSDETIAEQQLGRPGDVDTDSGLDEFLAAHGDVDAIGHRIVHGGVSLRSSRIVDDSTRAELSAVAEMAPLHVPPALRILDRLRALTKLPQVVCFDTAFHAPLDPAVTTYAIPRTWRDLGVRRYGFHGLSYAWATRRAAQLLGRDVADLALVIAHIGSGASVCAVLAGRSVDTTMGFTPLEGLVMATRAGSVDPGALLWLQTEHGITADAMIQDLERGSGWKALAGTADMRELMDRARDAEDARLARDCFVRSARGGIAAMATSLPRIDGLVFTGGIGTHQAEIRRRIIAGLHVLNISPQLADGDTQGDAVLSAAGITPAVVCVEAREDLEIAGEVRQILHS